MKKRSGYFSNLWAPISIFLTCCEYETNNEIKLCIYKCQFRQSNVSFPPTYKKKYLKPRDKGGLLRAFDYIGHMTSPSGIQYFEILKYNYVISKLIYESTKKNIRSNIILGFSGSTEE